MSADEMFKELGYEKISENAYEDSISERQIFFATTYREVWLCGNYKVGEIEAINQKYKELGWIKESE